MRFRSKIKKHFGEGKHVKLLTRHKYIRLEAKYIKTIQN